MTEKQQLDAELTAILKHLPGWQLDPKYADHTWCAVLSDGNGRGIHVNSTHAKGRFCISGMWPWTGDRQQYHPVKCKDITVARNRPPEEIAAEIQRRFLPWYTAAYAAQTERVKQQKASHSRQQRVAAELAALLGTESDNRYQVHAHGVTVIANYDGSASIDIRYKSLKVAKAVLRALVKADGVTE
jgi:hypothetical protein